MSDLQCALNARKKDLFKEVGRQKIPHIPFERGFEHCLLFHAILTWFFYILGLRRDFPFSFQAQHLLKAYTKWDLLLLMKIPC